MSQAIAIFLAMLFLSAVFLATAAAMVYRLTPELRRRQELRWMAGWFAKGVFVPLLLWLIANLGVCWSLQPFMPEVQAAKNRGEDWVSEYLRVAGIGLFILCWYWAAGTLLWTVIKAGARTEGEIRKDFKALCWTCSLGLLAPAAIIVLLGGWPSLGLALTAVLAPLAGYAPVILRPMKMPPMYARAVARMKFGKYSEAEWEIIHELEKCEDDFQGWMMLAELYGTNFNDLAEAEQIVLEICDQPKTSPSQLSIALHRLADWHLKAGDPEAARRALEMLRSRLPQTHLARMAQLRINQLPATAEELREQQSAKPIPLPALGDSLDDEPSPPPTPTERAEAATQANACVELLRQDPNQVPARERLARLLAERLDQPDAGIEQLRLLLNLPEQPDTKRAEWLGCIAAWNLKFCHDLETGRKNLERILHEYPDSPQALAARRRLQLMGSASPPPLRTSL